MSEAPAKMAAQVQQARDDPFEAAIRAAQADIAASVEKADLRNDPLRYPLAAISTAIGFFPDLLRYMRQTADEARQPLDASALERMEKAAARGASRSSEALVRAHNRRSVLIGSLAILAAVAVSAAGGYWWGHSTAITDFRVAEAGFSEMVHDSPTAATGWYDLARLNDYDRLMVACHGDRGFTDSTGRHACLAPLWLEPLHASAPPQGAPPAKH